MPVQGETIMNSSAIERFSAARQEPQWMRKLRLSAWNLFNELPMPKWDRTDPKGLDLDRVASLLGQGGVSDQLPAELTAAIEAREADGAMLVQRNGNTVFHEVSKRLAEQGVIFTDMETAVREHAELVQPYFMTRAIQPSEDKFVALHTALWSGGAFVYVPLGVEVEIPIQVNLWVDAPGLNLFPHTLIVADKDAKVTVIESTGSAKGNETRVHCGVVQIVPLRGSEVRYGAIQNWATDVFNFTYRRALLDENASLDWVVGELGSKLTRAGFVSELQGNGSRSHSSMIFFGHATQHLDVSSTMRHIGSNTDGTMETKGALKDKARAVYRGLTKIERGARESSAYQRENTLLLSDQARNDAIPALEIDEDAVRAGHAATAGQVDEEQLFYLMSRGISRGKALEVIVKGFFEPIMQSIPLEGVRNDLQRLIDGKMRI